MHPVAAAITNKLEARLAPLSLTVADDSHRHAGHAGAREGGGSHFTVTIVSAGFEGLSRVARHRLVYAALGEEFARGLHALAITALTPEEMPKG